MTSLRRSQKKIYLFLPLSFQATNPLAIIYRINPTFGITNDMLIGAPDVLGVLFGLRQFIGNNIIVGHNIGFDMSFINQCVEFFYGSKCFDTKVLSKIVLGDKFDGGFSQLNLEKHFGVVNNDKHRAIGDCMALFEIVSCIKDTLHKSKHISIDDVLRSVITNNTITKSNYEANIV